MRLKIHQFIKNFGVIEVGKLQHPKLWPLAKFDLPQECVVQFFDDNSAVRGPNSSDPMFAKNTGKTYIEHVIQLAAFEGNPRRTEVLPQRMQDDYRRQNKFFKPMRKDEALLLNPLNVLVCNFNMLDPQWKYSTNFKSIYQRWNNDQQTYWQHVAAVHRRLGWNQIIDIDLPEKMPELAEFNRMAKAVTTDTLEVFRTRAQLNTFDLFRWLGDDRKSSHMALIPEDALDKIILLFRIRSSFFVLSLGDLDRWRADPEIKADKGLEAAQIQRRFLSLMSALVEYNNSVEGLPAGLAMDVAAQSDLEIEEPVEDAGTGEMGGKEVEPEFDHEIEEQELAEAPVEEVDQPLLADLDFGDITQTYTAPQLGMFTTRLDVEKDELAEAASKPTGSIQLNVPEAKEDPIQADIAEQDPLISGVTAPAYEMYKAGMISAPTYEKAKKDAMSYLEMPDPFGSGKTFAEAMVINPEDLLIPEDYEFPDKETILDKSMLGAKLKAVQRKYNDVLLKKDILNAVLSVQKQGAAVIKYDIETVRDSMNHYLVHTVVLKSVKGKSSPIRFRTPVIDKDGRFMVNGVTYRQRLQRGDIPIRKVAPARVALTSYINKTFVARSDLAVYNWDNWLLRQIRSRAQNKEDESIDGVLYAEIDQSEYVLPRIYTALGRAFRGFRSRKNTFYFRYLDRAEYFKKNFNLDITGHETDKYIVAGVYDKKHPIMLDSNGHFYLKEQGDLEPMGTIIDIVGIDATTAPLESATISVGMKALSIGFVLAYHFGLTNLLKMMNVKFSRHRRGERLGLGADSYVLAFQDDVLVFDRSDYKSLLILGGLRDYRKLMQNYSIWDFDRKDVYFRLLIESGKAPRFTRDIDALFSSWVDPITHDLLVKMGEPTTFDGLLFRAVEMLTNDWSPAEVDGAYMRYRGYERIAGTVCSELNKAVKQFNSRQGSTDVQITMRNYDDVWSKITRDPTVATIEDSNPLANIREQEAMTYRGDGGRGSTSMVARTRIYHQADVGVVSESTVDSSDVGVIAYLTPDANFDSLRGTTRPFDPTKDGMAKQMSTCALLAVASTNDDAKRVNFISIQQQQGIYADGYKPTPLRTGYEQILALRTSSIFASAAEQDGKVVSVDEWGITVLYKDGEKVSYQMGKVHGTAAGVNYPHSIKTDLKVGDSFAKGDTLAYNEKYFQQDRMTPGQVIWKAGVNTVVAFCDNLDTLEDGSVISEELARDLNTQTTDIKNITVRFDQDVSELVKVGDHVDLETILCIIEDPETASGSTLDKVSREVLRKLSAYAPTAKMVGHVSKIECYYHGDIDDLTGELRKLAQESDKVRAAQAKARGEPVFTGEVDHNFKVKGRSLEPDTMVIQIYIDHDVPCGVGDKGVIANQMKTVFSRVMKGENRTQSGLPLGLLFGNASVEARMVLSPKIIATATILLSELSKHVAGVYRGTSNAKSK